MNKRSALTAKGRRDKLKSKRASKNNDNDNDSVETSKLKSAKPSSLRSELSSLRTLVMEITAQQLDDQGLPPELRVRLLSRLAAVQAQAEGKWARLARREMVGRDDRQEDLPFDDEDPGA